MPASQKELPTPGLKWSEICIPETLGELQLTRLKHLMIFHNLGPREEMNQLHNGNNSAFSLPFFFISDWDIDDNK